ncbi:MAG: DUF1573 domain-containing protein [Parcubacteria group bacterium]|nr:DUF1573 domain-containing protein [Parcubacteria group bacterium]
MKQPILYVLGLFILLGATALVLAGTGGGDSPDSYSASVLLAVENDFDFGTVPMQDGIVTHSFTLSNDGTEPVRIEKVYTSCMCTTAVVTDASGNARGRFGMSGHGTPSRSNIIIAPGEQAAVEAEFDPAAHGPAGVGLARRSIYLETNSQKSPKVELRFSAVVIK